VQKPTKKSIIDLYVRLVKEHGGRAIGERVFTRESGVSRYYWQGGLWSSWSGLQAEAGFAPNDATDKTPDEILLLRFAELALEMNTIPTEADLMVKRKSDPSFPAKSTFRRWGSRDAMLAKVAEYCATDPRFAPVAELLAQGLSDSVDIRLTSREISGFVYLLRSGRNYKLGRTNAVGRRLRELAIQLPKKPDTVHVIETDDAEGIEQYWHNRFAGKRQGGEWFALSAEDVKAFKRRRFQ
jgi:hypothetical protein